MQILSLIILTLPLLVVVGILLVLTLGPAGALYAGGIIAAVLGAFLGARARRQE